MVSIDGQIRSALVARLTGALASPGPDDDARAYVAPEVIPYQASAYRPGDGVLIQVQVGGWQQHRVDTGGSPGQRVYSRVYDAEVAILADERMETLAETLNGVGDRCMAALADYVAVLPSGKLQDLAAHAGSYHREQSEEGSAGVLSLTYTVEVLVGEDAPTYAAGGSADALI